MAGLAYTLFDETNSGSQKNTTNTLRHILTLQAFHHKHLNVFQTSLNHSNIQTIHESIRASAMTSTRPPSCCFGPTKFVGKVMTRSITFSACVGRWDRWESEQIVGVSAPFSFVLFIYSFFPPFSCRDFFCFNVWDDFVGWFSNDSRCGLAGFVLSLVVFTTCRIL